MSEEAAPQQAEETTAPASDPAFAPVDAPVESVPSPEPDLSASDDYPESLAEVMGRAFGDLSGEQAEGEQADPAVADDQQASGTPDSGTTPTEPAAEPGSEAEASAESVRLAGLRELLRKKGYDSSKWQTDEAALDGLVNLARKVGARDEDAELGRRLKPFQAQFEDFLANQYAGSIGQQQAQQQQSEQPTGWWNPPPVPENWRELVERTEDGGVKVRDGVRADVAQQVEGYLDYHRNWQTKLQTNPTEALRPLYEQAVADAEERAVQRILAHQNQQQQQQSSVSFIQQNRDWMFSKNQNGEFLRDPETGNFVGTPAGRFFYQELKTLVENGVDEQTAQRLAIRNTQLAVSNAQRGQATQAAPSPQPQEQSSMTAPTQRAVPPGMGGGRSNTGLREKTPQSQYGDAATALADAFKDYTDEQVRDIILS